MSCLRIKALWHTNILLDKSDGAGYTEDDSKRRTLDPRLLGKISRINVGQAFFALLFSKKEENVWLQSANLVTTTQGIEVS